MAQKNVCRTELTPVSFLERSACVSRRRGDPRGPALHVPAVRGAREPSRLRPAWSRLRPIASHTANSAMLEATTAYTGGGSLNGSARARACPRPLAESASSSELAELSSRSRRPGIGETAGRSVQGLSHPGTRLPYRAGSRTRRRRWRDRTTTRPRATRDGLLAKRKVLNNPRPQVSVSTSRAAR